MEHSCSWSKTIDDDGWNILVHGAKQDDDGWNILVQGAKLQMMMDGTFLFMVKTIDDDGWNILVHCAKLQMMMDGTFLFMVQNYR